MQLLGLFLLILNFGSIVAPVAGVAIIHYENIIEVVMPPEIENIVDETVNAASSFEMPQFLGAVWDEDSYTSDITFSFTNTFAFNLTLNQVSAYIKCTEHGVPLGSAALSEKVHLIPTETKIITVIFTWTEEAENHFATEHSDELSVDVTLSNLVLDVSGITIETPEQIVLSIPTVA
ncbi:MAG: hypothetical protein IAX21_06470 [Candidatus Bathyarchaeota archaeon]|nr:hypothetical protein [Candidatus Bathyarchaeum tardum]WGM89403.1 MAG: hypothetical protein NUK63_10960 [Candidatus Bathyarchaeum tardum]WNZ28316.1 MAG: hypothetical protein IAX21_06470 [Candidatus Bathyarchaeota archaeon]